MGGPRLKRCAQGQCRDRMMRGGKRVQCTICGDIFPCRNDCNHLDCGWVRSGEHAVQELVMFASPGAAWETTSASADDPDESNDTNQINPRDIPPGGAIGELGTMECFEDGDP